MGCKPIVVNFKEEVFDWECSIVSLKSSFFKCLGLLNTLEHPERFRYLRELVPKMLLGMLIRFTHPSRFSVSRFGTSPKSGSLIRFLECFRSIVLKLGRYCDAKDQQKWRHYLLLFKCFYSLQIIFYFLVNIFVHANKLLFASGFTEIKFLIFAKTIFIFKPS